MASETELLRAVARAVSRWDADEAEDAVREALREGVDPARIVSEGLRRGMDDVCARFDRAEIYLPQVTAASRAMEAAMAALPPSSCTRAAIVMGTVRGDIHDIGRRVCCAMLTVAGYKVVDLGHDVAAERFIEAAENSGASVIGASALMTTTLPAQREVVLRAKESGERLMTVFGGATCTREWCDEIGADGYSACASDMVALVEGITGRSVGEGKKKQL